MLIVVTIALNRLANLRERRHLPEGNLELVALIDSFGKGIKQLIDAGNIFLVNVDSENFSHSARNFSDSA